MNAPNNHATGKLHVKICLGCMSADARKDLLGMDLTGAKVRNINSSFKFSTESGRLLHFKLIKIRFMLSWSTVEMCAPKR